MRGDPRDALAVTDGIDDRQLDGLGRIAHLGGRCLAHTERGEVAKARRDIDATSSLVVASLDALDVLVAAETQVPALILTGHLGEAAVVAQRTTQLCQTLSPLARASAAAITGMVALARGDLGQALQLLGPPRRAQSMNPWRSPSRSVSRAVRDGGRPIGSAGRRRLGADPGRRPEPCPPACQRVDRRPARPTLDSPADGTAGCRASVPPR